MEQKNSEWNAAFLGIGITGRVFHLFCIFHLGDWNSQGWTGLYTLVVPSLSRKFIKNSHQNWPV